MDVAVSCSMQAAQAGWEDGGANLERKEDLRTVLNGPEVTKTCEMGERQG